MLNTNPPAPAPNKRSSGNGNGQGQHGQSHPVQLRPGDPDPEETAEWFESIESVLHVDGPRRARYLLEQAVAYARETGIDLPPLATTPYVNTIAPNDQASFAGDAAMEQRIENILRWNAMAMVQRANKKSEGIGGHIATFASSALLYEIGFNHFFKGPNAEGGGDLLFIQGHGSPGIYARAFLEGRLTQHQLEGFRQEVDGTGLSSYPHPWLMPDFWQTPTVSMGLGPIAAIYQARFNRYLHNRGIKDTSNNRVWCFIGDGESDEPETLGALSVAAREGLNNLVFVANCNLQRLDGPVRGNGKIIQDLEGIFRGAGWRVIKCVWGSRWDTLFERDTEGLLVERLGNLIDGQFQKFSTESGAYIREHLFGGDPALEALVEDWTDDDIKALGRGGHDRDKVYAAFHEAVTQQERPTVILAKTIKGYGLGKSFAGANTTHQQKKMQEDGLTAYRDSLQIPLNDEQALAAELYHPGEDSDEVRYLKERRKKLGGPLPQRNSKTQKLSLPQDELYAEFSKGSKGGVEVSSTMAFVRLLKKLMKDKTFGPHVVPIIPDEARTFGMESMFREFGIYAPHGQKYEPVDSKMLLNYHETKEGQLLEEGITEAGSMASFTAAATAYSTHGIPMIPFYIFYSMFGFQRIGDQAWALGDMRGRGFLLGATAGRTTLNGEGLQHEDGHSQFIANMYPTLRSYDPAFAFEVAAIIRDGLHRMVEKEEDVFYYLTLYNENHDMPEKPGDVDEGIIKGMYRYRKSEEKGHAAQLFGSGTMLPTVLEAQERLQRYGVAADVWSVTSYQQLYRDARATERHNRLHPTARKKQTSFLETSLKDAKGPVVTCSDWISELPSLLGRFVPNRLLPLGTDGFGRSDTRESLRRHFEIDAAQVAYTTLYGLYLDKKIEGRVLTRAQKDLEIDPDKVDPLVA